MTTLKPSLLVDRLATIQKPRDWNTGAWTEAEKTELVNTVCAISTLSGLQYYSASRKEMRTFYESSFAISDIVKKTPIKDPVFKAGAPIPTPFTLYAQQKDLTFGDNIYRYDYYVADSAIYFVQQNITAMSYGIIPLLQKEKLNVVVAFIDAGDSLNIYIATMAKVAFLPAAMRDKVSASFSTRAEALLSWLGKKLA